MKNQSLSNARIAIKNTLTPAAFACLLLLGSISASANEREKKFEKVTPTPVEVKYLGLIDDQPVFQMNINNIKEDDLYVTLKDENGNTLYSEQVKEKKFSKKFQFNEIEKSDLKVTISLSSRNFKRPQVFEIANVSKMVEDIVVTEL